MDNSGFCYGGNPPDDLPQSACLTAYYRQPDQFRAALFEISATGNMTATPKQFARHLQKIARDALAGAAVERPAGEYPPLPDLSADSEIMLEIVHLHEVPNSNVARIHFAAERGISHLLRAYVDADRAARGQAHPPSGGALPTWEEVRHWLALFVAGATSKAPKDWYNALDQIFCDDAPLGAWRRAMDAGQAQPVGGDDGLPIELRGIQETVAEGRGVWRSCSGCHELDEGHDTGPRSKVFGCALGVGCSECGGIGAVWDTTDYGAMGDALADSMAKPQPSGSGADGLDAAVDKAWSRFQSAIAPTDDELEEFAARYADEQGCIHGDSHADMARALLDEFAKRHLFASPDDTQPQPAGNAGELLSDAAIETLAKQYDCHSAPGFKGFAQEVARRAALAAKPAAHQVEQK
ncbi:hypothetical protein D8I35_05500 [Corticibacter populi]|uniref:Cytochrome c domain-containing protein n=2 Tax=Corticibacter populi TaxID=1550736 RepID=A0A3M6R1B9_9BURK|nr:hypothetical protein D8I35_05500 [Corticibacter populi]